MSCGSKEEKNQKDIKYKNISTEFKHCSL